MTPEDQLILDKPINRNKRIVVLYTWRRHRRSTQYDTLTKAQLEIPSWAKQRGISNIKAYQRIT